MVYYVKPNFFNAYLSMPLCQSIKLLYLFTHKKKTAKLTAFNLINNLEKKNYGVGSVANVSTSLSCR